MTGLTDNPDNFGKKVVDRIVGELPWMGHAMGPDVGTHAPKVMFLVWSGEHGTNACVPRGPRAVPWNCR